MPPTKKNKSSYGHKQPNNREGWLTELALQVQPLFRGFNLGPYRLTCGWPSKMALGRKIRVLGECHADRSSKGGVHEIFITPLLDEPVQVAGVACHELAHVAAGVKSGHKGLFLKVIKQVGLTKNKPKYAAPGPVLEEMLRKIVEGLGTYPHQAMNPFTEIKKSDKKDYTLVCSGCGCKCRMSEKWIDEAGLPTCACGTEMELKV